MNKYYVCRLRLAFHTFYPCYIMGAVCIARCVSVELSHEKVYERLCVRVCVCVKINVISLNKRIYEQKNFKSFKILSLCMV